MPKHKHGYSKLDPDDYHSITGTCWSCERLSGSLHFKKYVDSDTGFAGGGSVAEGNCAAHNNMPPYKPVLYLIKIVDER